MRLIIGLAVLIASFALVVRFMPPHWALPLYVLFVALTVAYTGWERRRIAERRRQLQRELHKERMDFGRQQSQRRRQNKNEK